MKIRLDVVLEFDDATEKKKFKKTSVKLLTRCGSTPQMLM